MCGPGKPISSISRTHASCMTQLQPGHTTGPLPRFRVPGGGATGSMQIRQSPVGAVACPAPAPVRGTAGNSSSSSTAARSIMTVPGIVRWRFRARARTRRRRSRSALSSVKSTQSGPAQCGGEWVTLAQTQLHALTRPTRNREIEAHRPMQCTRLAVIRRRTHGANTATWARDRLLLPSNFRTSTT